MNLEDNKRLVVDFFESVCRGDVSVLDRILTSDFTWWRPPSCSTGLQNREQFLEMVSASYATHGYLELKLDQFTAENDRVSVTASGRLKLNTGKVYENDYHFLIKVQEERIGGGREYLDSVKVVQSFGTPAT